MGLVKVKKKLSLLIIFSMVTGLITPISTVDALERTNSTDLIISEYLEGSSNNKAIELYNGTGQTIDLSTYTVELYTNGSATAGNKVTLSGTIENGKTYVIYNSAANDGIKAKGNKDSTVTYFNGDDALILKNGNTIIDSFGQVGFDPGANWSANGVVTADMTLIRKPEVLSGDIDPNNVFDPSVEWIALPKDDISNLGTHIMNLIPEIEGLITIDSARKSASGSTVKVRGIVTYIEIPTTGTSYNYTIQDGTGAIALRGEAGLKIGEEVVVEGKTSDYRGLLQINPYTLIQKGTDKKALPTPLEVKIGSIVDNNGGETYESQRIKVSGVRIGAINTSGNTTLTDIDTGKVLNIFKAPLLPNVKEGDIVNVVGILSQYTSYQLRINHESQVVKVSTPEPPVQEGDKIGPEVINIAPAAATTTGDNRKPEISASFSDETGIDMSSVKMSLDNVDVTTKLFKGENTVKYNVENALADGKHKVVIEIKDTLGNVTTKEWSFSVGEVKKNLYFGQLHSHTNISDGQGTIDEAYTYAKDTAKLDFFAVTDHSNWFDNDTSASLANGSASKEWVDAHATADKYNKDGDFTAIYGFEMTWSGSTGGYGHINTFNTPGFETRTNSKMDLKTYYSTLKTQKDSISQLNHPGKTFGDFMDFGLYDTEIDKQISLVEVGNGEGPVRGSGYFPSYELYTRALDKGWHVAPTNNQDNHKAMWGTANTARTVIEAPELTREALYSALREMRVYSTEDNNFRVSYEVNGNTMGSMLPSTNKLSFSITVQDPDNGDNVKKISIIGEGGKIIKSLDNINTTDKTWEFTLDKSESSYYYVRVDQSDKDITVTAPVWVGEKENIGIADVKANSEVVVAGEKINVNTTLYNNEAIDINNVKVDYFINRNQNAVFTENVSTVPKAGTAISKLEFTPEKPGDYEFIVKATMNLNGVEKVFTSKLNLEVISAKEVSKVVIDGSHFNQYVTGNYAGKMTSFTDLIAQNGGKPIINTGKINDELLQDVKLLVLTDPQSTDDSKYGLLKSKYDADELEAIKRYTDRGGNIIIASRADYGDATGEYQHSVQSNVVLEKIGATTRFNDDQPADTVENGGQAYRLYFDDYNVNSEWLKSVDLTKKYSFYSGCSVLLDKNNKNSEALVYGHSTTESTDADKKGDNTPVAKGEIVGLAIEKLSSGAHIIVSGTSFLSDFEIDGDSGEHYSNRNLVNELLKKLAPAPELPVSNIADVRLDKDVDNNPDRFGETVVIEGYVTAASNIAAPGNSFFDVIYIQDGTAGITVFGVSTTNVKLGQKVRIKGRVSSYLGDAQIAIKDETSGLQVIDTNSNAIDPKKLTTKDSMLENNEGLLVKIEGKVVRIEGQNIFVNDGSGEARVYTEGYVGSSKYPGVADEWKSRIKVGDSISAIGLASEDPEGHRLRVRDSAEIVIVINNNQGGEVIPPVVVNPTGNIEVILGTDNKIVLGKDAINNIVNGNGSIIVTQGNNTVSIPFSAIDKSILEGSKEVVFTMTAKDDTDLTKGLKAVKKVFEFNLSVVKEDGSVVQIHSFKDGVATITITLTDDELKGLDKSKLAVFYYNEDTKKYEVMETTVDGNKVTFKTPHFSKFIIAEKTVGADGITLPNTGGTNTNYVFFLGLMLVLGGSLIFFRRREELQS